MLFLPFIQWLKVVLTLYVPVVIALCIGKVLCTVISRSIQKLVSEVLKSTFRPEIDYISNDGNKWICKTCDRSLTRGSMPVQAMANNLQLSDIPSELSGLNALELRLISLRVPFMKIVALPSDPQCLSVRCLLALSCSVIMSV